MGLVVNEAGDELVVQVIPGKPPKTGITVGRPRAFPRGRKRMFYTEGKADTFILLEIGF